MMNYSFPGNPVVLKTADSKELSTKEKYQGHCVFRFRPNKSMIADNSKKEFDRNLKNPIMRNGYYVYILECADGTYYTGMTNNIDRRFAEHEYGIDEEAYTFSRRPLKLVWGEKFLSVRYAFQMERKIKKWSAAKKRALIEGRYEDLPGLAKCKNATSHENFQGKKNSRKK